MYASPRPCCIVPLSLDDADVCAAAFEHELKPRVAMNSFLDNGLSVQKLDFALIKKTAYTGKHRGDEVFRFSSSPNVSERLCHHTETGI